MQAELVRLRFLVLSVVLGSGLAEAADPIEIDPERGEIRFPCRFVNPSQLLEVFGCHVTGPTHETVLEFEVTGPQIYAALEAIGARNASYWNGTSPDDFVQNQGDRLLVSVRWEYRGTLHEHPAEGMLFEGDLRFPMFVRGFSFGARAFKVAKEAERRGNEESAKRPPGPRDVPEAVEFSLGAALRHQPPNSLLSHPTSSARMQRWMLPPVLDTGVVQAHRELVEKGIPATLIIRRLNSEVELIAAARRVASKRGLFGGHALYDRLEPIARLIDRLKSEYEEVLGKLRKLIQEQDPDELDPDERARLAESALALVKRGRWLCARIQERYLAWYAEEEAFKSAWVEEQSSIEPALGRHVLELVRDGFAFEPRLARKEAELARLEVEEGKVLPAERRLRSEKLRKEMEELELERADRLSRHRLREALEKISALKAEASAKEGADVADDYLLQLFDEDRVRWEIEIKKIAARRAVVQTEIAELSGLLDGSWEVEKTRVLKQRRIGQEELRIVGLESELLEVVEELRWAEDDTTAERPKQRAAARKKLVELQKKKKKLEAQIEAARKALKRLADGG